MKESVSTHDASVAKMFGGIADFYDFLNHRLSFGIDYYWRHELAKAAETGEGILLDLAAGTADVSIALAKKYPRQTVLAFDFCEDMLRIGHKKCRKKGVSRVIPVVSDAKKIPIRDNSVACITIAFGIRNIQPRSDALREMLRVLKPGGKLCVLEFGSGKDRILGGLYNFYLQSLLPRIGSFFSKDKEAYRYLAETICAFPTAVAFEEEIQKAGFVQTGFRRMTQGIVCLHTGTKSLTA